ncbi:MAG: hypothetical protein HY747_05400 [Elusimicrobia bacterium]|nr:hypothetical protein [Elusimicrobiota bacterium]
MVESARIATFLNLRRSTASSTIMASSTPVVPADCRRAAALFKRTKDRRGLALLQVWSGRNFGITDAAAIREAHLS